MMMDLQEQYDQLCKAITAIENGAQSYKIGSQSVTKASLSTLYKRQERLESQIRQANGDNVYIARFADRG